MTNPTMTLQGEADEPSPFTNEFFMVQGAGFRCMAYRDDEGKWCEAISNRVLPGAIRLMEESPARRDGSAGEIRATPDHHRRRKKVRIKQRALTPSRQPRFLLAFFAAVLVLFAIARVMLWNNAPEPQSGNQVSQTQASPAPGNVNLKIVEEKRS